MRVRFAGFTVMLLFSSSLAMAQTLYRWSDADGKTHYGDRPPKNAIGVTRIDTGPDTQTLNAPLAPAPPEVAPKAAPVPAGAPEKAAAPNRATQRRETRERLRAEIDRAVANLELAKKRLADGDEMQDDERQVVQRTGGKPPVTPQAQQNCRQVTGKDGKLALMCPLSVPSEQYYDRIAKLEEAVRQAEEALAAAEAAYRRGVD
jgi:hypothetical protein